MIFQYLSYILNWNSFYGRFNWIRFEEFYRFINHDLIEEPHKFSKIEDTNQEIKFLIIYWNISMSGIID